MAYAARATALNSAFRKHVHDLVKQSRASRLKAEQDRGSLLGEEFIQYYKAKGEDPWANLPPIEVTVKILELRDLQTNIGTFFCTFLVMLDWKDESLSMYEDTPPADCLIEHFHPKYEIFNVTQEPEFVGGPTSPVPNPSVVSHVKWTAKFRATLSSKMNMLNFPFDSQMLQIVIFARNITTRPPEAKKLGYGIELCAPRTFRKKEGISIAAGADWLDEWQLKNVWAYNKANPPPELTGEKRISGDKVHPDTSAKPKKPKKNTFIVEVAVERVVVNVLINVVIIVAGLMLLSLTAFGVGIAQLVDRGTMVSTTLLTLIAFKWILAEVVPKVRYLTVLENYIFLGEIQLFLQGIGFWIINEVFLEWECVANTEEEFPFFRERFQTLGNSSMGDETYQRSCTIIRATDRLMLVLHIIIFIATQGYMIQKAMTKNSKSRSHMSQLKQLASRPVVLKW